MAKDDETPRINHSKVEVKFVYHAAVLRGNRTSNWHITIALLCSGLLLLTSSVNTTAQEKKREKFGSSLKRVKWDKKKEVAVDKDSRKDLAKDKSAPTSIADAVRIETSLAVFDLLVTDRQGYAISGLTREDFIVTEDGVSQQVSAFVLGDDAALPRSIVLILDYSPSQIPYLQMSVTAAKTLVEQLRPNDKMALVTDDVSLLLDFTQDKNQLNAALDLLQKKALDSGAPGQSKQFSALFAVLRELLDEQEHPIIIFQTDGDELPHLQPQAAALRYAAARLAVNFSLADIIAATQRKRVTIYSIISGIRLMGFSYTDQLERARQIRENLRASLVYFKMPFANMMPQWPEQKVVEDVLREQVALATLAAQSGGWHDFLEQSEQATTIYKRILTDISRRYIVGYYPTNESHDGSLRKVQFGIRGHPECLIIGRRSYYAPSR